MEPMRNLTRRLLDMGDNPIPLTKPFIIWTLQRTGGTNFNQFLCRSSVHSKWEDEPFSEFRECGHVTKAFKADGDKVKLAEGVREIMKKRRNIKHCVEKFIGR